MSIYQSIYDIIVTYIFGGLELTATQTLVTELFSVGACFGLLCIPFLVVAFSIVCVLRLVRW